MSKNIFLVTVLLFIFQISFANNEIDSLKNKLEKMPDDTNRVILLNELAYKMDDSSYQNAIDILNESQELAKKINYQKGLAIAYFNKGLIYFRKGLEDEALEEYTKALKLVHYTNEFELIGRLDKNIGDIYDFWGKHHIAIDHYLDALELYESLNDKDNICSMQLRLGNAYSEINDEKALNYYELTLQSAKELKDTTYIVYALNNIGLIYMDNKNYEKALKYYQYSLDANKYFNECQGKSAALSNIGSILIKNGNYKKALEYINKAQLIAKKNNLTQFMISNYQESSIAYEKMGIYKKSLELYKEYVNIKDSLYDMEKHEQIVELEAQYESERKDKEIELLEHKDKNSKFQLYSLLTGLVLFSIFGFFIYRSQKNKISKDKEIMSKNKFIHEAQKKLTEAEKKEKILLQEELENKKSELINFALHIIHKNELIQDIKSCLRKTKLADKQEQARIYSDLILKLNQNLKTNDELQEFQVHVEKVNHDYFYQLYQKFPDLTGNEKRLSALLRLNLSSKEIATLNNISVKAVEMGRYRLRKKMGLNQDTNLSKFLQNI